MPEALHRIKNIYIYGILITRILLQDNENK